MQRHCTEQELVDAGDDTGPFGPAMNKMCCILKHIPYGMWPDEMLCIVYWNSEALCACYPDSLFLRVFA